MNSEYFLFFEGTFVESMRIINELKINEISFIIKDEQKSANLAGFGIPNYLYSVKIFIKKKDLYKVKNIYKY